MFIICFAMAINTVFVQVGQSCLRWLFADGAVQWIFEDDELHRALRLMPPVEALPLWEMLWVIALNGASLATTDCNEDVNLVARLLRAFVCDYVERHDGRRLGRPQFVHSPGRE